MPTVWLNHCLPLAWLSQAHMPVQPTHAADLSMSRSLLRQLVLKSSDDVNANCLAQTMSAARLAFAGTHARSAYTRSRSQYVKKPTPTVAVNWQWNTLYTWFVLLATAI
jgi:hypothetical protein